ncbi:MAG: bifunctional phosphoglucose/phosphomannose isomerase [Candidatus Eisenbacteria bacterium]
MAIASLTEADCRSIDRADMAGLIAAWPAQVRAQRAALDADPWPRMPAPSLLALGGMGGSAIAGNLVFGLAQDRLPFPTLVVRDYRWPAAVAGNALAVLSSYSGTTEETLALLEAAEARGLRRVGVTTGGVLAARLDAANAPWRGLPAGLPPRAALGYSVVSLARLLEALGDPGEGEAAWLEALAVLEEGNARLAPAAPEAGNPAKALARALVGRAVVVYGSAGPAAAVARRWKGQVNENAKTPAFDAALPEMNHNEIVGWQALPDLHARCAAVFLADASDAPRIVRRREITRAILAEEGIESHEVKSTGESALARLLSLVQVGDWMSYYLAVLAGVDPTPIVKIDRLKRELGAASRPAQPDRGRTP